jgi:tetratricopeptide (TPR) repeat protein
MIFPVVVLAAVVQTSAPVTKAQQAFAQANDYVKQQQYDKALAAFDEAIALDPKSPDFPLGKCRALAAASRHTEAIPVCTESLRLRPDNAEALRDRGHYYLNLGQVEPALADLTRAAGVDRTDRGVYYHLGVAYYLKGDFPRAAAAYQSCLDNSKGVDTIECIAWLYPSLVRADRKQEAAALLDRVHADASITGHPAWYLDRLLLFKGARTEEQVAANLNVEGALSLSSIGYSLGLWHLLNGRAQRAREYFEKAVATNFTPAWGYRCSEAELKRTQ